ncbi:hypothetical protein PAXRUDRAFT_825045 [Paxillus rubicundulus Ve08.2h10]|uniref:Uncharacterized protein n=1 Tax=Paxillus rubicundulus Ve08.2h10 TaxID=930991 RepID=A0A0D0EBB4_9AGAM|nr:hypothetical protein PAXRUDRAFT_825045 [Paxillus rubicundulus Ve08.2h10]
MSKQHPHPLLSSTCHPCLPKSLCHHFWSLEEVFISVYGKAHQAVLTPKNICSAFQKIRIWPLNPHIVTKDMMAPSLKTCCHNHLPFTQCSPVRIVMKMLRQYQEEHPPSIPPVPHTSTSTTASTNDPFVVPSTSHEPVTHEAPAGVSELASTSVGFLLNNAPLTSTTRLPVFSPPLLAAVPQRCKHHLLDRARAHISPRHHAVWPAVKGGPPRFDL